MSSRRSLLLALLILTMVPAQARAQWHLTPFAGVTFGADTPDTAKATFGGAFGWTGAGILGFEVDVAHTPDFFNVSGISDFDFIQSSVTTGMVNVLVDLPLGGSGRMGGVRPFVTAGVGVIRSDVEQEDGFFAAKNTAFGFNAGAGVAWFFSPRLGARGDVRYFRHAEDIDDREFSLGDGTFDFWRGSLGVTFRF